MRSTQEEFCSLVQSVQAVLRDVFGDRILGLISDWLGGIKGDFVKQHASENSDPHSAPGLEVKVGGQGGLPPFVFLVLFSFLLGCGTQSSSMGLLSSWASSASSSSPGPIRLFSRFPEGHGEVSVSVRTPSQQTCEYVSLRLAEVSIHSPSSPPYDGDCLGGTPKKSCPILSRY